MKEHDFIKIIQEQTNSRYLGDDCAYLDELGITVSQDNFIENIHFKTEWASPYQIGYKAALVNISDILASGAKPAYITIGLSLPNVEDEFIKQLYKGIQAGSYGAQIIGGDITGGDSICISITAIGKTHGRKISSRKNAKESYVVITRGDFGKSSLGLIELVNNGDKAELIREHLEPRLDVEFSELISTNINTDYAMMDTSDGLADALFQIARASNVTILSDEIEGMFGAEDYKLVAAVPIEFAKTLSDIKVIGHVVDFRGYNLQIGDKKYFKHDDLELFNHFN